MFECQCCGAKFSEPALTRERRDWWGSYCYEEISGCPRCGGSYIEIEKEEEDDLFG